MGPKSKIVPFAVAPSNSLPDHDVGIFVRRKFTCKSDVKKNHHCEVLKTCQVLSVP